ncbi:MAG: DUF554 domain-containing protein, partial [Spirochaetia bacterium]|nr:DUF554 domain-containing protein [Spirochaetia bacterium]
MPGMLRVAGGTLESTHAMLVVMCIVLGTVAGELMDIDRQFEKFGGWLKKKTGNAKDVQFVDAFVNATMVVSIGAMAIVGAIQDGISGDFSILAVKSVLDFIIIVIMTSSMGKGCAFSAIPVFVFEGLVTLSAKVIEPVLSETAINNISFVGSILIFCVGLNLLHDKKIRVANMLPALILAVAAAYLPISR